MTTRQKASRRAAFLLLAIFAATLAFAGPTSAHHGGDDHPGIGHDDEAAGQIASFDPDTGVLVIDLSGGGSVSGLVTARTWIESRAGDRCEGRRRSLHGWCRRQLHGFDHGDDHGWNHGPRGGTDDLVPGTTVEDALLVLKDGRAFFWKVDLAE